MIASAKVAYTTHHSSSVLCFALNEDLGEKLQYARVNLQILTEMKNTVIFIAFAFKPCLACSSFFNCSSLTCMP